MASGKRDNPDGNRTQSEWQRATGERQAANGIGTATAAKKGALRLQTPFLLCFVLSRIYET